MKGDVMVSVRFTPTEAKALDQLVEFGHHDSRSALLRALAMQAFIGNGIKATAIEAMKDERWDRRRRRHPFKSTGLLPAKHRGR